MDVDRGVYSTKAVFDIICEGSTNGTGCLYDESGLLILYVRAQQMVQVTSMMSELLILYVKAQ